MRGLDRSRGVNLIVSALLISILIFSIQIYAFKLSGDEPSSPYSILTDYMLHLKQGSGHAVTASLVNISQGGSTSVLSENMGRWGDFVEADYRFGLINVSHTLHNQAPYSDGVWLDWGENGTGVSSVAVDFDLDLGGRGVESGLGFPVNVTTSLDVSGDWLPSGLGYKWVIVDMVLQDDEGYALGGDFLVEYEDNVWLDAASAATYNWNDYGNGSYRCEFNTTHPGGLVRIRTQVHDRRDIFVQAEIRLPSEILDQLTTESTEGKTPSIIHVANDIYAIAYSQCPESGGDLGLLKTVKISNNGQINDTIVDSLTFDPENGKTPDIIHVSGDVYAIAYSGDGDCGLLKTINITSDGQIGDPVLDSLEFDALKGKTPDIIKIAGDIYAIAYSGDGDVGFLKTVNISSDGQIGDSVLDSLEYDSVKGIDPIIVNIAGDVYAVAYSGDADVGNIFTIEIYSNGTIADTFEDTLTYDPVRGKTPDIINIAGDVYAIAYAGDGDVGFLATVNITSDGQVGDSMQDSLEFDPVKGKTADVIHIEDDVYAVAYAGDGDDGILITVSIQSDGQIGGSALYLLEFDPTKGKTPALVHVTGDVYALAYSTDDDLGILLTIEITKNMEN